MCYKKETCPLYDPNNVDQSCKNCIYLQHARESILHARIALGIALVAFIVITCIVW